MSKFLSISIILLYFKPERVESHGRLIEPPSRASAWRYGFSTPHNYNDHELYCGGFTKQWAQNQGKCGVCGDAWDLKIPRPHEFGGTYGQGVIVRQYERGQTVTIRIELTASHFGHFEFSICPNYRTATQECLDKNVLRLVKPQENVEHMGSRYFPKDGNKVYEMKYRLPKIDCPHCLLQWRYIAGNNWGDCGNGTGAVGCGHQEEFRACADISIGDKTSPSSGPNDIPDDVTPVKPLDDDDVSGPTVQPSYSPVFSLVTTLVSFLVICSIFFLIFFHYYRLGYKFKRSLANFTFKRDKVIAPVAPPRGIKKIQNDGLSEISLKKEENPV